MRRRGLILWYFLLAALAADILVLAGATLGAEYGRQRSWRHFAAASAGGQEIDKVPFAGLINACARREGLDAALVAAVIRAESSFQPRAVSPAGARGLMQVIPSTWREVNGRLKVCNGRHSGECGDSCYFDPELNIRIGTAYLGELYRRYQGDALRAVAAYNAGPAAVDRHRGLPPFAETEEYVARVVEYWYGFSNQTPPAFGLGNGGWQAVRLWAAWGAAATAGAVLMAAGGLHREYRSWRWR